MPSVSNMQSLEDERIELINNLHRWTKSGKEVTLRRIREIERQLGIDGIPYNSSAFGG